MIEEISTVNIISVSDAAILVRAAQEMVLGSELVNAVDVTPKEFSQSEE